MADIMRGFREKRMQYSIVYLENSKNRGIQRLSVIMQLLYIEPRWARKRHIIDTMRQIMAMTAVEIKLRENSFLKYVTNDQVDNPVIKH